MAHHRIPALLLLATVSACPAEQPGAVDAEAYADAIAPLTEDNGLLAWRVLHLAADVHDGRVDGAVAAKVWRGDVVPLAWHLRDQAALVGAPPTWANHHEALVGVWTDRADAYEDLADAMEAGDSTAWADAKSRANAALMSEEELFKGLDEQLRPHGIEVDQFP